MSETKVDRIVQKLDELKEAVDDLYEGQQAIKDMLREVGGITLVDEEAELFNYAYDDLEEKDE